MDTATGQFFTFNLNGKAVALPLFRTAGGHVYPLGYFERRLDVVRHWVDFLLAEQLRDRGTPIVDWDLITAGEVVEKSELI